MATVRRGPGIREFLTYYLLVLLASKRRTTRELVDEIKARSAENRFVRSNGPLCVSSRETDGVLCSLADRGWVGGRPPHARWRITSAGRRARREMEQTFRGGSDHKPRGASELIGRLRGVPKGSYVLDVGTGEGFLARRLAKHGFRVLGVDSGSFDYSRNSIEKARRQAASDNGSLAFLQADVARLRRPSGGFDIVVSSQAVHCMKNQHKCLRAIYRLLKPGGRFLSLDFLVNLEGFQAHGFHCFLAISREEWAEILPAIGFADIHTQKVKDYLIVDARKPRDSRERIASAAALRSGRGKRGAIRARGSSTAGVSPASRRG